MDFIIDTVGDADIYEKSLLRQNYLAINNDSEFADGDFGGLAVPKVSEQQFASLITLKNETPVVNKKSKKKQTDECIDEFMKDMGWSGGDKQKKKRTLGLSDATFNNLGKVDVKEALKTSVITPDFQKQHIVPSYDPTDKKLKAERKLEREKTKGKKWFNMPATEVTEEIKKDLQVLQMRSVLDPKRFYKKNDLAVLPKYFQVGKVMDSKLEYYSGRLTNKERKKTMVDELMADAAFSKYNKKRYQEIITDRQKGMYRAHKNAKRLKGKRK